MSSILSRKAEGHMYPLLRTLFPDSSLHVSRDKPHAFLVSHPDDFTQYRIQPDGFWEHEEDGSCGDIIGLVEKVKRLSYEEAEAWLKDFLQNPAMHFSIPDNIKEELKGNFSDQRSLHAPRELSEESIAMKYAGSSLKWLRHIPAWKRYLVYDDVLGYWKYDEKNEAKYHVRNFCRGSSPFVADATARKLESNKTADAVLNLVGTDQRLVITPDQLDADPWMLNTPNRVYNFRSGRSRKMHRHTDYFTKVTAVPVDDDMETPLWDQFLLDITAGDSDVNAELMAFFRLRVEKLLALTSPKAGLILVHHTNKIPGKLLAEDPMAAISGGGAMLSYPSALTVMSRAEHDDKPGVTCWFDLRYGPALPVSTFIREGNVWQEIARRDMRLVRQRWGEMNDKEQARKRLAILTFLYEEALEGRLYNAESLSDTLAGRMGLGSGKTIRAFIRQYETKGFIRFIGNGHAAAYDLPKTRSKYGYLCVEGMKREADDNAPERPYLPTHFRCPHSGQVFELKPEDVQRWQYGAEEDA